MVIGRSQIRLNCAQMTGKVENGFRNGATSQLPTIRPELGRQRNGSMRALGCGYPVPVYFSIDKKQCPHWCATEADIPVVKIGWRAEPI
jgi:hypothetical protein